MKINEVLSTCLSNMKASDDLNDYATVSSIKDLLSCIIDNPAILINCANEEKLSIALSSILTCQFPSDYLSRSAGFPPLSPSRTVHATFTAHGSCNSVNYLSF